MAYLATKLLHSVLATLSISGFVLRSYWMLSGSGLFSHKVTRVLPHLVDTLFFATGVALAMSLGSVVWLQPWFVAKLIGLVIYIALGVVAFRLGASMRIRATAIAMAILAFVYIIGVAVNKSPASWLVASLS